MEHLWASLAWLLALFQLLPHSKQVYSPKQRLRPWYGVTFVELILLLELFGDSIASIDCCWLLGEEQDRPNKYAAWQRISGHGIFHSGSFRDSGPQSVALPVLSKESHVASVNTGLITNEPLSKKEVSLPTALDESLCDQAGRVDSIFIKYLAQIATRVVTRDRRFDIKMTLESKNASKRLISVDRGLA